MSAKKRSGHRKRKDRESRQASEKEDNPNGAGKVALDEWSNRKRPTRRSFDGPQGVQVALRITFDKSAYADVVLHAKESLENEICGVLVGEICEDNEGLFVLVKASIRGKAALQGRAHVTFTQQTWNAIHEEKDKEYSGLQIVGWYHSHPGFGVEISDMDRFIHESFFSSETQLGFVTDPLSGEVAVIVNSSEGVRNVDRFWIDTREHRCYVPERQRGQSQSGDSSSSGAMTEAMDRVNTRLSQVIQALDDLQNSFFRFLSTLGFIICLGIVVVIGYHLYTSFQSRIEPPELRGFVRVPVQIGDKTVLLGVAVMQWDVPPELNATYLQLEQMKREAAEKAKQKAAEDRAEQKSATQEDDVDSSQEASEESNEPEE